MAGRPAQLRIDILADGKKAEGELDRVGRAGGKLGGAIKAGAAIGVAAVGALAVSAAKSASDVEQAVGASEKVFGRYASSVQTNAGKADRALGLSKSGYLDLANVIGTQLKNAGTPMDQVASKTDKLITKGADLAATFGGSTADAVSALSSAMKGELDPIERYGVSIKQSDVNARLAEQGLDKLTGAAAKTAQQQALLALINEQTASTTGAFADESNTAAGVGARASAVWENMKATLGAGLLPVLVAVGTFFLDTLAPAAGRIAALFSQNVGPSADRLGAIFTQRIVPAARAVWSWFQEKILPSLQRAVLPIIAAARDRFARMSEAVERNRPAIEKVTNVLRIIAEFIAQKVAPVVGTVLGKAFELGTDALVGMIDVGGRVVGWISDAVAWFQRLIDKVQAFADKVRNSGVGQLASSIGGLFGSAASPGRLVAASMAGAATLTAAAGGPALASPVNVSPPDVRVYIGQDEITSAVRVVVRDENRQQARRAMLSGPR